MPLGMHPLEEELGGRDTGPALPDVIGVEVFLVARAVCRGGVSAEGKRAAGRELNGVSNKRAGKGNHGGYRVMRSFRKRS